MRTKKKSIFVLFIITGLAVFYGRIGHAAGEYHVIKEHSTLVFEVKNSDAEAFHGKFTEFGGNIITVQISCHCEPARAYVFP